MRKFRLIPVALACLSLVAVIGVGCGEAEELIDCQQICEKKRDCVDDDYNVDACVDDCETRSDDDESYHDKAHECEACLDGKACAESVTCLDNCPILK